MINNKAEEVVQDLFQSLLPRYEIGLETTMEVVVLSLIILYEKCHQKIQIVVDHM